MNWNAITFKSVKYCHFVKLYKYCYQINILRTFQYYYYATSEGSLLLTVFYRHYFTIQDFFQDSKKQKKKQKNNERIEYGIYKQCIIRLRSQGAMVLNATLNNMSVISWRLVLLVEETRGSWENHRHVANNRHTLSYN